MTDTKDNKFNEIIDANEQPNEYEPREGDILKWGLICVRVSTVREDGSVELTEFCHPGGDFFYLFDPPADDSDELPVGVETWAAKEITPTTSELRAMLRDKWELIRRNWQLGKS
jgi:hypothetical protein